jgi:DNA-binding MarR family transcriptional regulator
VSAIPDIHPPSMPDPPTETADLQAAMTALRALILASEEFRHTVAAHLHVGVTETVAMSYLAASAPLTARELSQRMGLAPSSITSVLDRLEAADLARRAPVPGDRRRLLITLTDRGPATLAWSRHHLQAALASLGEPRLPEIAASLSELAAALRTQTGSIADHPVPASIIWPPKGEPTPRCGAEPPVGEGLVQPRTGSSTAVAMLAVAPARSDLNCKSAARQPSSG